MRKTGQETIICRVGTAIGLKRKRAGRSRWKYLLPFQLRLRAATMEAAHDLAAQDPMHLTGCRSFTLRRWLINEGSLSVTVGLSGRTIELG